MRLHPDRRLSARLGFPVAVVAAAVALGVSLWTWGLPLSNDGPAHVLAAYVANHPERYEGIWEVRPAITSRGFFDLVRLFEPLVGWRAAWRLTVIVAAEVWAFGYLAFVVALAPGRRWLGLLGFAFALHSLLYLGLLPFTLATAAGWFALALWLRAGAASGARAVITHVVLALVMYVGARLHVFPAALAGLLLVVITLARSAGAPARTIAARVGALALAGAPAALVAVLAMSTDGGAPLDVTEQGLWERLWVVFDGFPGGPPLRAVAAMLLCALGVAGLLRRRAVADDEGARAGRIDGGLALAALVLLIAAWSLPLDFAGWQLAGMRFAPVGVCLLCALAPLDDQARVWRAVTAALVVAFVAGSLAWSFALHATLRADNAPVEAALEHPIAAPIGMWSTVTSPPRAGEAAFMAQAPRFRVHMLFAVEHGGDAAYAQDSLATAHHVLRLRPRGLEPLHYIRDDADPARQALILRRQLSYASAQDGLVQIGTSADLDEAVRAGFVPIVRSEPTAPDRTNGVLVARFEGCAGRLRVEGAAGPVALEVGWWPTKTPSESFTFTPGPDAPVEQPLAPLGCGEVWVRAGGGAQCAGQGALPVRAVFERGADNVLVCRVEAAPTAGPGG